MEKITREAYLQKINFDFTNDTYKWKYITALNLDSDLSSTEIRLMIILLNLYNSEKGYAFPSIRTLCRMTGNANELIQKSIRSLTEKGYIKILKSQGKSNHYRLTFYDVEEQKFLR